MASNDQLQNPKAGTATTPSVALSDIPIQGHPIAGSRGIVPAANGTTVLISKTGKDGATKGSSVSAVGRVSFSSFRLMVNGATPWATGTVTIQDTAGNLILQFPASVLTANARVNATTANVVVGSAYDLGAAAGEGIVVVVAGYTTGSPLQINAFAASLP